MADDIVVALDAHFTRVQADAHAQWVGVDVEQLESLTLEDFATDFSQVQMPVREGRLSDVEMSAAVERFMTTLRAR